MVNWSDPAEIAKDSDAFLKLTYALFGVYVWELFMTCDFEWSLISRRRKFRWPLSVLIVLIFVDASSQFSIVFFFLCRYCILFSFIGLIISFSVTTQVNCSALYTFNSWTGNMAILCASTSLMLRTIALWECQMKIVVPLGALCVAHWGLLYRGMFIVTAAWDRNARACVVTATNPSLLKFTFFFTMGFDFIILCFTSVALTSKHSARTGLWKLLFKDGLVYFLVTFSTNSIPAVLNVLDLNSIMNVIATVPAAAVSSIAACRAVIRLQEFNTADVYIHSASAIIHSNQVRHSNSPYGAPKLPKYALTRPEVHVTTEHITMAEFPPSGSNSPYSKTELPSHRTSSLDLESAKDADDNYGDKDEKESSEYTTIGCQRQP